MPKTRHSIILCAGLLLLAIGSGFSAKKRFDTPVGYNDLDFAATAEWVDGKTNTDIHFHHRTRTDNSRWVIFTKKSGPGHSGIRFGVSENPGIRHFRVGFKRSIPVGTIITSGGGTLSILKSDSPYPGKMANNSHWQTPTALHKGELTLWILPPGTKTRALRFSQRGQRWKKNKFKAHLAGAFIKEERLINLTPYADLVASTNTEKAKQYLSDFKRGGWRGLWENDWKHRREIISERNPEKLYLFWPQKVRMNGLCALWAGFRDATVEAYQGPQNIHPREAKPKHWKTVGVYQNNSHMYPRRFAPNFLMFKKSVKTHTLRLTFTKASPAKGVHSHVDDKPKGGKRIWLGELMVLHDLGKDRAVKPKIMAKKDNRPKPPIPLRFSLKKPGYVTLVVEDAKGRRVRNLISETYFKAGQHTVFWDGMSVSKGRGLLHGVYQLRRDLVTPGKYSYRGLVRDKVNLRYQMTPYNAGTPPWRSPDGSGSWMADHSPPYDALYLPKGRSGKPEIWLTAFVVEAGSGLIGVTPDQGRRLWGIRRLGGAWTGGSHLTRDLGRKADKAVLAYIGSWWSARNKKGEVRLTGLTPDGRHKNVLKYKVESKNKARLGGLAVYNGMIVASLPEKNMLLFVDAKNSKALGTQSLASPGSLVFAKNGRLYMVRKNKVEQYTVLFSKRPKVRRGKTVIAKGLEDPQRLALGPNGKIYVSDWGKSHQVKVFSGRGKLLQKIGNPGGPQLGKYDPKRMSHPYGITITPKGRLWVAEKTKMPKRVSLWQTNGAFVRAFYGPAKYGGGGTVDPQNKNRFYYSAGGSGLAFSLDWKKHEWKLTDIYFRASRTSVKIPCGHHNRPIAPEQAVHYKGRHYMTNAFNSNPTSSPGIIAVWLMSNGIARPVAAVGSPKSWKLLHEERFHKKLPSGLVKLFREAASRKKIEGRFKRKFRRAFRHLVFAWSDLNFDGKVQANEVTFKQVTGAPFSNGYIDKSLRITFTYGHSLAPTRITSKGVPVYQAGKVNHLVKEKIPADFTSGGRSCLTFQDKEDWQVRLGGPMRGFYKGKQRWTYPNQWPGLHAGHNAPTPQHPGQIIAATRLMGFPVVPKNSEAGPIWAVNGDKGAVFLMTYDGLYVATLGGDGRVAPRWNMDHVKHNMLINGRSFIGECFWPTINQTSGKDIYLVAGKNHLSILKVDGLESIRRFKRKTIKVTKPILAKATEYNTQMALHNLKRVGRKTLSVPLNKFRPRIDGDLGEWKDRKWATLGKYKSRRQKWLKPDATIAIFDDKLYAAFRTEERKLLKNTGESWKTLFKSGGALDIKLATNANAPTTRKKPVAGDLRLLVARVKGKTLAVLYKPVAPGSKGKTGFSSPWRTFYFDSVTNVSRHVKLAGEKGKYELSIPLKVLGFKPKANRIYSGDLGIIRGSGGRAVHRLCWHNKATAVMEDIPSEAMLRPNLWGRFKIVR